MPYLTLFLFCMKQGCRIGEARALKWDWVNLKHYVNRLQKQVLYEIIFETYYN